MKEDDLLYIKRLLTDQLNDLETQADSTFSGLIDEAGSLPDLADQASLEAERENLLRKRDRENRLMRELLAALQRIENDTYGICDSCGEDIAIARLKVQPLATLCIACKTQLERAEKQSG